MTVNTRKTYRELERGYYGALHELLASRRGGHGRATKKAIPYALEQATQHLLRPARCCMLSGISGSGKTTITGLLEVAGFRKLPNVTTRPRRDEERGEDYVFTDADTFLSWKREGKLFHPHKRNGVWHAILQTDVVGLKRGNRRLYADKSVAGVLALAREIPIVERTTLVYILAPSFRELYNRIVARENMRRRNGGQGLSRSQIFDRFHEEISDMRKSAKLPYVYIVNDTRARVARMLRLLFRHG